MDKNIILVLGISGAGKDFVSRLLDDYFRKQNISSLRCSFGDKLRQMKAVKSTGDLTEINVVIKVLKDLLLEKADIYIFDGFPRSVEQLECVLNEAPSSKIIAIALNCSEEIAIKRLGKRFLCPKCSKSMREKRCNKCHINCSQREDDLDPEVIKRRVAVYNNDISKIINMFEKNKIKIQYIDTSLSLKAVEAAVLKIAHKLPLAL